MRPLKRAGMNRKKGASSFRRQSKRTNSRNIVGPMRGGIRL